MLDRSPEPRSVASVEQFIISLIKEKLGAKDVTRNDRIMYDLGADSLDVTEIIMQIEEEYDLDFESSEEDLGLYNPELTVHELIMIVENQLK